MDNLSEVFDTIDHVESRSETNRLDDLHHDIIDAWNRQDHVAYANCFLEDALVVGLDGTEMHGPSAIAEQLGSIFADHEVATYVRVMRS